MGIQAPSLSKRRQSPGAEPPLQFSAHVFCGQTAGWIKMALGMEVGLIQRNFVLDGDPAPYQKRGRARERSPPIFGPRLLWPNGRMDQDGTWHGGRPRAMQHCDIAFDVDPATPRKGHTQPYPILAHVYCGQMAGWTKTPVGTKVDLGPGHIVLDGVQARAKRAQQPPPLFGPRLLWPRSPISANAELLYIRSPKNK